MIFHWSTGLVSGAASFSNIRGIDPQITIDLSMARPAPRPFPAGAYFEMDARHPKEVRLVDQPIVACRGRVLLGPKVVDCLQRMELSGVRLLPVELRDHKGCVASSEYCVLHCDCVVDGVDTLASGAIWNSIAPDSICDWDELVLKDEFEPPSKIFRLRHIESFTFITQEMKQLLDSLGVEGAYIQPLEELE